MTINANLNPPNHDALTDKSWKPLTRGTYWVDRASLAAIAEIRNGLLSQGLSHSASDAVRFALIRTSRELSKASAS